MGRPGALIGILLLILPTILRATDERADYLIVPNPGRLPLYDQFQHRMNDREKKALPYGIAFKVIDARALLGDGIIPCVAAEFAGTPFYLERENQISPAALSRRYGAEIVEDAAVQSDTLNLLARMELTDADGRRTSLVPGDRVLLLFESRGRSYVTSLAAHPRCGWITIQKEERGTVWTKAESGRREHTLSEDEARKRITPIVDRTNRLFPLLAVEFSGNSGRTIAPPALQMTSATGSLVLRVSGTSRRESFRGTLRALKARIQAELPGLMVADDPVRFCVTVSGW